MVKKKKQVKKSRKKGAEEKLEELDEKVKEEGEKDTGAPVLSLCPRCGSSDLTFRKIDVPGFAPDVQVCNKCGFRSESAVEVSSPLAYIEEVGEEEETPSRIEEISKKFAAGAYTTAAGNRVASKKAIKSPKNSPSKPKKNKKRR